VLKIRGSVRNYANKFTSHEFILKMGRNFQEEYFAAGASLIGGVKDGAIFRELHSWIGTALYNSDSVEQSDEKVPSKNIWGNSGQSYMGWIILPALRCQ
jgi:hypothetical protein